MSQKIKENGKGMKIKTSLKLMKEEKKSNRGITLIALVITMIVSYDKIAKGCNIKGFLYFGYKKDGKNTIFFLKSW